MHETPELESRQQRKELCTQVWRSEVFFCTGNGKTLFSIEWCVFIGFKRSKYLHLWGGKKKRQARTKSSAFPFWVRQCCASPLLWPVKLCEAPAPTWPGALPPWCAAAWGSRMLIGRLCRLVLLSPLQCSSTLPVFSLQFLSLLYYLLDPHTVFT